MAVLIETPESWESHKHAAKRDLALLLMGAATLIFALAFLLFVLWKIFASTQATSFDADGVRCYSKADQTVCLKTAEPPR